jgi:hypothetical protein
MYLKSFALLFVVGLSSAMAFGQAAVDTLKSRLVNQPITLNLPELRLSRLPHAELKVVGGVPRPGMLNLKLDTDEVAHHGDTLTVRNVEGSQEKKNDFLRITVATASGASAKLALQFEKGALAGMDEAALDQAIASVLTAQVAAPPAQAAVAVEPERPMPPIAPPPPPPNEPAGGSGVSAHVGVVKGKILELEPAGPGLPPMDLPYSGLSVEKCWSGYYSAKFGIEIALHECNDDPSNNQKEVIEETDEGLVDTSSFYGTTRNPMMKFYKKAPAQSLSAAIKEQLIDALPDTGAKLGCRVVGPKNPAKGLVEYHIVAVAPYSHRKSFPGSFNNQPCGGFGGTDTWVILARPDESRTRFVALYLQSEMAMYDQTTLHFSSEPTQSSSDAPRGVTGAQVASSQKAKPVPLNQNEKIPPMKDIWLSQGRTSRDLADEASTVVSFTHGMMFNSSAGDAIMAVSCEKSSRGTPVLMLHAEIPVYQGMQQTLANKTGTISIGNGKHDEQLTTQLGSHFLDVAAPLNQTDVAEMSATQLAGQRDFSLMYFGGAGRDIAAGDLPPANEALDAVLNACSVTTPVRNIAQPQRKLSPDEIAHLQLAKLSLGMTEAQAKQGLGAEYRFAPGNSKTIPNETFLLAADSSNVYGMLFFDHALKAFTYRKSFAPGAQPLVLNLINDLTTKTWLPLVGSSVKGTSWSTDASGIPITVATQNAHPNCGVVRQDGMGAPPPFSNATTVNLLDTGPDCGVTVRLELSQADDKTMARDMVLMVVDYRPIHALVSGVKSQQQQQKIDQQKKAGQIATPF